jgi:ATP-binding cassette subfamily B (MDR/TAP) protein 1
MSATDATNVTNRGIELKSVDYSIVDSSEKNVSPDNKGKVNDAGNKDPSPSRSASIRELLHTAEPLDYLLMFWGVIGGIITGFSIPFFNILFGRMLDALNSDPNSFSERIGKISIAFVITAVVNLVSGTLQVFCWTMTGERQSQKLREKYVHSILSQEIAWFDMLSAAELSTKVAEYTGKVEDGLCRKVGDLTQYIFQLIGSFIAALYLCWELTVVLLAAFPIIGIAGAFMIYAITEAQNGSAEQYGKAGGIATETLSGIRTVAALNVQIQVIEKYRQRLIEAMRIGAKRGFNVGLGNGLVFGACFCFYGFGFWYGTRIVARNLERADGCMMTGDCISGGTVMAVFFCVIMGSMSMGQIAPPLTSVVAGKAALGPMMDVINRKPLIDSFSEEGLKPDKKSLKGRLELRNVSFSYPSRPNIEICKDYSVVVNPGESIALVGKSGCGKSTIVNLLLRFYDPQQGQVVLDDFDIKSLNIRWLRSNFGYVGQEPVLFSGSILDNIAYGIDAQNLPSDANGNTLSSEDIKKRVIEAAKQANAHDFIMSFPNNYNTDVGSNGSLLSGGQKQRVAIARALIRQPTVLLLDEATSALDATSERIVQESIDELSVNRKQTLVIIAHRLSTIRNATKIAVINEGRVNELGNHDELIAKNGLYADLVRLQMTTGHDAGISDAEVSAVADSESGENDAARKRTISSDANDANAGSGQKQNGQAGDLGTSGEAKNSSGDKPKEVELSKERSAEVSSRIWTYIRQNPGFLIMGILGAMLFGGVFPFWGFFLAKTQKIFYYIDPDRMRRESAILAGWYCLMGVISVFSSTSQFYCIAELGERVSLRLRSSMFESLLRRPQSFFDREENSVGVLTTRLSDDSRIVLKATGEALAKQIQAFFTLTIGMIIGFSASWKISLVVISMFPVNIIASSIQMQAIAGGPGMGAKEDDNHGAIINSAFTHMKTVIAFSMQRTVSDEYNRITRELSSNKIKKSFIVGVGFGGSQCILFLTYSLLFWYGSTLIDKDNLSFEKMMTSILSLMLGALGMGQAMTDIQDSKSGFLAADRIFTMVDEGNVSPIDGLSQKGIVPPAILAPPPTSGSNSISVTSKDGNKGRGKVEIKNVRFKYPSRPDIEVCKGYNLVIEPGTVLALVGPSGSGKSTIMNLLLRFYDPDEGQILLDGVDIKELNIRWLRSQIGYVGQEPVLFSGSVKDNVKKGKLDYRFDEESIRNIDISDYRTFDLQIDSNFGCCSKSKSEEKSDSNSDGNFPYTPAAMEEGALAAPAKNDQEDIDPAIVDACKLSNAHDFITSFTEGYNTDVGENSAMVSGGQKQRIAIARALINKPCVLLLDEATSALDASSEKIVQESIDKLQSKGGSDATSDGNSLQTIIVIAHRLSTIKNADKIAVIDQGAVVELGTHDELLAKNGLYYSLWHKQGGASTVVKSGNN